MNESLKTQLDNILKDVGFIHAELVLAGGVLLFIILGLFLDKNYRKSLPIMALIILVITGVFVINELGMKSTMPLFTDEDKAVGMITQTNIASIFSEISIIKFIKI